MLTNIIRIWFIFCSIFTGICGFLLFYMESYLPVLISRTYRYGKFSNNVHQSLLVELEIPKRRFKDFYRFAAPASSYVLYLVVNKYLWNNNIPQYITWMLNVCLGSFRQQLVSPESTFIAALLFTLHLWKRLYETHCVNIFSDKKINICHYIVGIAHYIGSLIAIIGESEGFAKGSKGNFSLRKITYFQLLCTLIFISSSYIQLKANIVLNNLRKDKDGKINYAVYKIPHDGLFKYVSGALNITEIIIYITLSGILWQSSTFHYVTIWVATNQLSTAILTHQWYVQTFENYPKTRKILLPYIF
ncbi:polyprenal reductase [Xylocopa sonorina]|uniref:polyprenal reductase n=1 Tax=Xylocopa sonorina TaxID=1818115 RepID=UPI00403AE2A2